MIGPHGGLRGRRCFDCFRCRMRSCKFYRSQESCPNPTKRHPSGETMVELFRTSYTIQPRAGQSKLCLCYQELCLCVRCNYPCFSTIKNAMVVVGEQSSHPLKISSCQQLSEFAYHDIPKNLIFLLPLAGI